MPFLWTHHYVLRPTAVLRALAPAPHPTIWFTSPHIWTCRHAGNHDYPTQEARMLDFMKMHVLAKLHATAIEKDRSPEERELARSIVDAGELTHERFDELWTIEPMGIFTHDGDATEILPLESLRAVRATSTEPLSPGQYYSKPMNVAWAQEVERRAGLGARIAEATRVALRALQSEFSIEPAQRRFKLSLKYMAMYESVAGVFEGQPWSHDPKGELSLTLEDMEPEFSFSFEWQPGARNTSREGLLTFQHDGGIYITHKTFKWLTPEEVARLEP